MTTCCPDLMVCECFGSRVKLLRMTKDFDWNAVTLAGSREEMDFKLAVMGMKTDWKGCDWFGRGWSKYQHRVWRMQ